MTIDVTPLTAGTGPGVSAVTAAISPTAAPLLCAVAQASAAWNLPQPASVAGCGLSWSLVGSVLYATTRRLTLLKGLGTPTPGALTLTGSGSDATGIAWSVVQAAGVDSCGAGVTAAGSGTVATLTLPGTPATGDAAFAAVAIEGKTLSTWEAGWTELHNVVETVRVRRLTTAWDNAHDATPQVSWAGSYGWGSVGCFLVASGGFQAAWAAGSNRVIS